MVNINQLFLSKPPISIIIKMLKNLGFSSLKDNREITVETMTKYKTIKKMENDIKNIKPYYLPCKARLFLDNLNLKKCITIVRQLLRLYDYDIIGIEKTINTKKVLFYHVDKKIKKHKTTIKKKKEYIIFFD